jgi:hypothetical protein
LLAARSIIFSKISAKEERTDDLNGFPHLRDELACIRATKQLDLDDCRRLFPLLRCAKSSDVRQIVDQYVAGSATTSKSGIMRKIHKRDRATRCW